MPKKLSPVSKHQSELLRAGNLSLDLKSREVIVGDTQRKLTPKESRLLEVFMRSPGKVLSREFLMKEVWETDYLGDTGTLDVHVRWLREKIEKDPGNPQYLKTVRGVGYRFEAHG